MSKPLFCYAIHPQTGELCRELPGHDGEHLGMQHRRWGDGGSSAHWPCNARWENRVQCKLAIMHGGDHYASDGTTWSEEYTYLPRHDDEHVARLLIEHERLTHDFTTLLHMLQALLPFDRVDETETVRLRAMLREMEDER